MNPAAIRSAVVEVDAVAGGPDPEMRKVGAHAWAVRVDDGRIADIAAVAAHPGRLRVLTPTLINAHDHGRGHGTQQLGVRDAPLNEWITAFLAATPADSQYEQIEVALTQMRDGGIGSVAVCINPTTADVDRELDVAAQAIQAVGMRATMAVPMFTVARGTDRADRERSAADRAEAQRLLDRADELADRVGSDLISVAYHPVGPQWVNEDVLAATAQRSAATGRVIHMHLFETAAQRRWADHLYPEGLLTVLDEMGLLSPRAVFAHGVHLTAPELELLAERGCSVVANVSSNFRLSSGVTPLEEWDRSRVPVAIGLDGMALDDDLDMWRELRLVRGLWQAQRRCGVAAEDVLAAATAGGIAGLGSAAPEPLRVGSRADFVVHDLPRWSAVAREAAWSAAELVLAGASRRSVAETWCGGVQVYRSAQSA